MLLTAILILAILLQLTAALLAVRLIRVTQAKVAWVLIALALALMALRRTLTLYQMVVLKAPTSADLTVEGVALAISLLMLLGIAWIAPLFASLKHSEEALRLNESRLQALWQLSQMTAASPREIADFTQEEGVRLTKSHIGFVGFLNQDETVLTIQSWSKRVMEQCAIRQKPIIYPLAQAGLWGEAVRQRRPVIINDYRAAHPLKKGVPEGHVPLQRLLIIPVLDAGQVVVVAAVANKEENYDDADVRQLTLLMNGMWWLIKRGQAEEALAQQMVRGQLIQDKLIETCMDGIIANDKAGNILIFNDVAAKIFGYTPAEVIGHLNVRDLYPPGLARDIKQKIYDPAYGEIGLLENYETVVRHKDGTLIPIWLSARLLYENEREVGVVGHFRDLRERKRLEEELLQSERLAVLGRMAAHLSHEIKNPLLAIGGLARQVRDHPQADPEKNREKLQVIIDEIKRLEDFLAETGSYARLSEPQKVPGDVNALVRETSALLEPSLKEHGIGLHLELSASLPPVAFDPLHLRQVFLNLCKNALEAMPQGGALTVATSRQDDQVLVEITDTGEGMAPEVQDKLFQPFYSTKPKGTGLGLAICRKIMEAHGGNIKIDSAPGQGTKVTLALQVPA